MGRNGRRRRKKHAKNLADACYSNNVHHVIWSTLENTREALKDKAPVLKGDYTVPHFDAKYDANDYFKNLPTTYFYTSFYYENFINVQMVRKNEENFTIAFNMDNAPLPMVSLEDIGKAAATVFTKPDLIKKSVYIASDILTCEEIAAVFSKHFGSPCYYYKMDDETYRKLPFPGAEEFGNMFAYKREATTNFAGNRKSSSKSLVSDLITFDAWVSHNKDKIKK